MFTDEQNEVGISKVVSLRVLRSEICKVYRKKGDESKHKKIKLNQKTFAV